MATFLHSRKTPSAVRDLLVRLVISAEEKKDLEIFNTADFDPARAGVVGSAKPFVYNLSLKSIKFDNMCLTSRGTEKNFRQTVVMATQEFTEDDLERAGVFRGNPSMEPRHFNTTDVTENPLANGAFYNEDDVRCLAARWKALLESALDLYKKLPAAFFDLTVAPDQVGRVVKLAELKVQTAPSVQEHREVRYPHLTATGYVFVALNYISILVFDLFIGSPLPLVYQLSKTQVIVAESIVDLTDVTGFEEETTCIVDLYDSMAEDAAAQANDEAKDQFSAAHVTRK